MPPHKENTYKALLSGLGLSSILTLLLMNFLIAIEIPITTVLPTSAPIWMGFATMFFLAMRD